jgi:hypothetical protein
MTDVATGKWTFELMNPSTVQHGIEVGDTATFHSTQGWMEVRVNKRPEGARYGLGCQEIEVVFVRDAGAYREGMTTTTHPTSLHRGFKWRKI